MFSNTMFFSSAGVVTTYSDEVLADSPILYYRLGESSGAIANDSSGNGFNGTYSSVTLGTTGLISGDSDTAVTFNGTSSYLNKDHESAFNVADISADAWIKTSTSGVVQQIIARDETDEEPDQRQFQFRLETSGGLGAIVFYNNVGGLITLTDSTNLADGAKHHVAFSYNSSTFEFKLYVDGVNVQTSTGTDPLNTSVTAKLAVGARFKGTTSGNEEFFNGVIDEAVVYDSVLGDGRFLAHYNKGA